ncbi:hypothetical protein JRO89_XS05G0258300 [Xanthoceras sorbifolium]|uniref:Uncharacterized protein n=1 Tax=Xanthoceras sorbifolium TaxID=99658 RepID=A0ABQ8I446_9ROSI|nr:hypothetical protein JRO89_XS05G0258300 [Xanthoceras sorbifolium]
MTEAIVSPIAELLLGKLGSLAYQEVCLIWDVKPDLLKLERTLKTIKAVLLDAEQQQLHNRQLRVWLEELKDVCYDAEDVLDEFEIEALRRQVMVNQGSIAQKVCTYLSWPKSVAFRFTIGHKIKEIRERLDEIAAYKAKFHLTDKVDNQKVEETETKMSTTNISFSDSDIIGRDKEKKEIIELLLQSSDGDQNVSIIPIVGIGGLGKTMLVRSVFNNDRIVEQFDLKIWVDVSYDFVKRNLVKSMIESVTGQSHNEMGSNQLEKLLVDCLDGKRYLIVMDNVWNENVRIWIQLKKLLLGGANGSKIIVTTRSKRVASIMSTTRGGNGYKLKVLSYESCVSLFMRFAFKEEQEKYPNLIKIGEEIVEKCGGVPLVVKSLACLLFSVTDENSWKNVRDTKIWDLAQNVTGLLPVMKPSYSHLQPHLKQCISLSSLFPKDHVFSDFHLISIWMANGLLWSSNEREELENVGVRYLKELESSSFFKEFELFGSHFTFKMHDLMHDLVSSLSQNECLIVNSAGNVIPPKVKHLSFEDANTIREGLPSSLDGLHLRSIFFPINGVMMPGQSFLQSCISRFPLLRLLHLERSDIEVLPATIGDLKHLRYLNLSCNRKIKKLPNSIHKLHKLQTLVFAGCTEIKELPRAIKYLISLRRLSLTTKQNFLPENVIGCLNSLRVLEIHACENLKYLFDDIGRLECLCRLAIVKCPSLLSLPRSIKHLTKLEDLTLSECPNLNLNWSRIEMAEADDSHQDLINSTQLQLRTVSIEGLQNLEELAEWLLHTQTVENLAIRKCLNFMALPESMQNLASLQVLVIEDCPKLSLLPKDMHRLIGLAELIMIGCPTLSERCKKDTGEDWPKIAHIPKCGEKEEAEHFAEAASPSGGVLCRLVVLPFNFALIVAFISKFVVDYFENHAGGKPPVQVLDCTIEVKYMYLRMLMLFVLLLGQGFPGKCQQLLCSQCQVPCTCGEKTSLKEYNDTLSSK